MNGKKAEEKEDRFEACSGGMLMAAFSTVCTYSDFFFKPETCHFKMLRKMLRQILPLASLQSKYTK